MAEYATCPRCGTTTTLTSNTQKRGVKIYHGKCKECGNKVIKEVQK